MPTASIALGSNLGNREASLRAAIDHLRHLPQSSALKVSSFHETLPVDSPPGAGPFLNAAAILQTDLTPEQLLNELLAIEFHLGRNRALPQTKNAPRPIDLDLLLYDSLILQSPGLTLPHPRMHLRRFVLAPLAEIAPNLHHPVLALTIRQLLDHLPDSAKDSLCK